MNGLITCFQQSDNDECGNSGSFLFSSSVARRANPHTAVHHPATIRGVLADSLIRIASRAICSREERSGNESSRPPSANRQHDSTLRARLGPPQKMQDDVETRAGLGNGK